MEKTATKIFALFYFTIEPDLWPTRSCRPTDRATPWKPTRRAWRWLVRGPGANEVMQIESSVHSQFTHVITDGLTDRQTEKW